MNVWGRLPRRAEPDLPDAAAVVRGGTLKRETVEVALHTCWQEFGVYGFSVYAHATWSVEQLWQRTPQLNRYTKIRTTTAGTLRTRGFVLVPTFDAHHYSLIVPGPLDLDTWQALEGSFSGLLRR